jgi:hypothetical protein
VQAPQQPRRYWNHNHTSIINSYLLLGATKHISISTIRAIEDVTLQVNTTTFKLVFLREELSSRTMVTANIIIAPSIFRLGGRLVKSGRLGRIGWRIQLTFRHV